MKFSLLNKFSLVHVITAMVLLVACGVNSAFALKPAADVDVVGSAQFRVEPNVATAIEVKLKTAYREGNLTVKLFPRSGVVIAGQTEFSFALQNNKTVRIPIELTVPSEEADISMLVEYTSPTGEVVPRVLYIGFDTGVVAKKPKDKKGTTIGDREYYILPAEEKIK